MKYSNISWVAPPKCLFHIATQVKKDQYTLIKQSAHLILLYIYYAVDVYDVTVK